MIVVAGESLVDLVVDDPASSAVARPGGSARNVALGLARLETPALLLTQLGDDDHGRLIAAQLGAAGAELIASPTSSGRTASATALLDAAGVASYAFDLDWTLPPQELPACDVLHVGSLGALLEPGRTSVWDLVEQAYARDVAVTYDPNVRADFIDSPDQVWRDVETLAERALVVKLSDEDIALLHPGADPSDIARSLLAADRTELVLLTRGAAGASAYTISAQVDVPAFDAGPVIDTVGAGDTFMAAVLSLLFEAGAFSGHGGQMPSGAASLEALLRAAGRASAMVCARPGADPPYRAELPPE